jgi:sugar (pentulose or hexulose) kinase
MKNTDRWILNYDFSTDGLDWEVLNHEGEVIASGKIVFWDEYGRSYDLVKDHGYRERNGGVARVPIEMIARAYAKMMADVANALKEKGGAKKIITICGGVQQHGMFRLLVHAGTALADANAQTDRPFHELIMSIFKDDESTSWRDTSSRPFAEWLLGEKDADFWGDLTGSSPNISLRFAGLQLGQLEVDNSESFGNTNLIGALPSLPALFLTFTVPGMGWDEASCTMLMSIGERKWARKELEGIYPAGTFGKLPRIVQPGSVVEKLASYWVNKHEFAEDCEVLMNPGDNPSAEASACLQPGEMIVSAGNSLAAYAKLRDPNHDPDHYVHVLCTTDQGYMGMFLSDVCADFANGVRNHVDAEWAQFDRESAKLEKARTKQNAFILPGDPDPRLIGVQKRHKNRVALALARSIVARAAAHISFLPRPERIYLAGGLAQGSLPQVTANMFQAPVVMTKDLEVNRVSRGSAAISMSHAFGIPREEAAKTVCPLGETIQPDSAMATFYLDYVRSFAGLLSA